YYRQLAREYPKDRVRDELTGQEVFDHLAADKRLLPFLEDHSPVSESSPLAYRELGGQSSSYLQQNIVSVLHPEGAPSPFMSRHRLLLEAGANSANPARVRLEELASGKTRWGPLALSGMP